MLTMALDEAGVFDAGQVATEKDSKTTMIGGFIFDDMNNEEETETERERIRAFYEAVIEEVSHQNPEFSFSYPKSLHVGNGSTDAEVKKVKRKISDKLPEFIKRGTYSGKALINRRGEEFPKRIGKYVICAVAKSNVGKSSMLKPCLGGFALDDKASNLYFHMASEITSWTVFHNPFFRNMDEMSLHIATRSTADIVEGKVAEYKDAGYSSPQKSEKNDEKNTIIKVNKYHYSVMNEDIYRTLVSEKILSKDNSCPKLSSFNVRKIEYKRKSVNSKGTNSENADYAYEFLYFADTVCGYLTYRIEADDIEEVNRRAEKLTGEENLIFAYDESDAIFERAWKLYELGFYYDALTQIYDIIVRTDYVAEFYKKKWIPFFIDCICKNYDQISVENAFEKLHQSIMTSNLDQLRAKFIFDSLAPVYEQLQSGRLRYIYNDIGVSLYCHIGDTASVKPYFANCESLSEYVGFEEYARTRNRMATAYCDEMNVLEGVKITQVTKGMLEAFINVSKDVFGDGKVPFGTTEYAKTCSLLGQCSSILHDPIATEYFDKALEILDNPGPNYYVTLSYKLHHLIDMEYKDQYIYEIGKCCGESDEVNQQISYIFEKGKGKDSLFTVKHWMYLYLKGAYYFYDDFELETAWSRIDKYIERLMSKDKQGHPWELINKYMALIAQKLGKEEKAVSKYQSRIFKCCSDKGKIIEVIQLMSDLEVDEFRGVQRNTTETLNEVRKILEALGTNCFGRTDQSVPLRVKIDELITYMYR